MAPDLLFYPVFNEREALARVSDREVVHPAAQYRVDQLYNPIYWLRLVASEHYFELPQQRRSFLELRRVVRAPNAPTTHLESRRVDIAGITAHPNEPWMQQIARNVTMDGCGILRIRRYLLHDRDSPRGTLGAVSQGRVLVKDHSIWRTLLRRAMKDYIAHYHTERNHQGKNNLLLFHPINKTDRDQPVRCRDRLGAFSMTE